ncbi:Flagellar hook-length control protein-like, C-terminal domain protein [Caldicellulosiruptor owensensis OL]|uniref:Flagellar hook-length control protein-like, C-terminal domain protein n=1 Tax=Caldicellulosiruptor owensensis (strain ATCC 700167 / DSM 13100 / OL) TaxID=632518 RepID=E4Q526_CALOW|nr:flagellar hook-length control protein FliK [Caldicellulosiruptor owensensis]ADQ05386.1 Flagellar hook-length control protein-like, C-terminal domain protein [Caldicellulosiruptor owensensis OL]
MNPQVVMNTNMLLFKTSAATSNTSNTKDMKNKSLSFKDILEKKIDDSRNVDSKDNVLPKRITVARKDSTVSSEKQTEKNEVNFQKDEIAPMEGLNSKNLDTEGNVQSQILQTQIMEFLNLIFNLFKSGENLDKLNLNQLFQSNNIQEIDFSNLQFQSLQTTMDLNQYLSFNNSKITILQLLQNFAQRMVQSTEDQQMFDFVFVKNNSTNTEKFYKLLGEIIFDKHNQSQFFDIKSNDDSILEVLRKLFAEDKNELKGFNTENKEGILGKILKEIENIIESSDDQKLINVLNTQNTDTANETLDFIKKVSSESGFKKEVFLQQLLQEKETNINEEKIQTKPDVLDLRQHAFMLENKMESISSFQDDKSIREVRMSLINQLAEKVSIVNKQNLTTLQVNIKPEWLGNVVIELSKDNSGKIFGNLIVTSPQVKEIIEGSLSNLLTILKDQGINISQLNVSLSGNFNGQQYQDQQRFPQRRNFVVQGSEESSISIESLIYEMSESILNLRA